MTPSEIQQLLGNAQEAQALEFKRAASLSKTSSAIAELVKDVSGMANAAGGRILYGIAEAQVGNVKVASSVDPITDAGITGDWITQVVMSNTGPTLNGFAVAEVPVAGGRVIVVTVDPASTAHQSNFDKRYYLRVNGTVQPMADFQIRDVMSRRASPVLDICLKRTVPGIHTGAMHQYAFWPWIANTGLMSLVDWYLEVNVPDLAFDAQRMQNQPTKWVRRSATTIEDIKYQRFGYASSDRDSTLNIHPGQELDLDNNSGYPLIFLTVSNANRDSLFANAPPLTWRLFSPHAKPIFGHLAFAAWSDF